MILSISGVLLLGALIFIFFKKDGLKMSHAIICALFGFYMASTSIAPTIRESGRSVANLISGISP